MGNARTTEPGAESAPAAEPPRKHRTILAVKRPTLLALHAWVLDAGAVAVAESLAINPQTLARVVCGGPCTQLTARAIETALRDRAAAA